MIDSPMRSNSKRTTRTAGIGDAESSFAGLAFARELVAARITQALDNRGVSISKIARQTGLPRSDLSRVRNGATRRFTLDRMVMILGKLDVDVEVSVTFRARDGDAAKGP